MQDQVGQLRSRGVPAAYLSSTQRPGVQASVWEAVRTGRLKLLYLSPERAGHLTTQAPRIDTSIFAVDEAHCISEWGHDFRPDYRRLGRVRLALGLPPTIAVTGTATPVTQLDVMRSLSLTRPVRIVRSFDRTNLHLAVSRVDQESSRLRTAARLIRSRPGSAIVYVPTRGRTDGVATVLRTWGINAAPYHGALPGPARRSLLSRFLDGRVRVIVATSAFGMGIDKADVRTVVHLGVPQRPEAYLQEAGRAGRDGVPAVCWLLWRRGDLEVATTLAMSGLKGRRPSPAHRLAVERGLVTMNRYLHTRRCRRRILLSYLGQEMKACSGCDRCR